MAKIRAGILSKLTGKVAGVVGGTWKNINYLREYVIPANPKTAAQVIQRNLFASCVDFCKPLVGPVFNVYTDKFQKAMSGFNFFIKRNIALFLATPTYASVKVTEGKLFAAAADLFDASAAAGNVETITFTDIGSNGKNDDQIYIVFYNENTNTWAFLAAAYDRSDGQTTRNTTIPMTIGDKIHCYTISAQSIGTVLDIISESDYALVTVAA